MVPALRDALRPRPSGVAGAWVAVTLTTSPPSGLSRASGYVFPAWMAIVLVGIVRVTTSTGPGCRSSVMLPGPIIVPLR